MLVILAGFKLTTVFLLLIAFGCSLVFLLEALKQSQRKESKPQKGDDETNWYIVILAPLLSLFFFAMAPPVLGLLLSSISSSLGFALNTVRTLSCKFNISNFF